jgi:hypothetical protein
MNARVTPFEKTPDVRVSHTTQQSVSACSPPMPAESTFMKEEYHGRQQ